MGTWQASKHTASPLSGFFSSYEYNGQGNKDKACRRCGNANKQQLWTRAERKEAGAQEAKGWRQRPRLTLERNGQFWVHGSSVIAIEICQSDRCEVTPVAISEVILGKELIDDKAVANTIADIL